MITTSYASPMADILTDPPLSWEAPGRNRRSVQCHSRSSLNGVRAVGTISYNPDGMWKVGHHIFPEMHDRHLDARGFLKDDKVQDPQTLFSGEIYGKNAGRWKEMV